MSILRHSVSRALAGPRMRLRRADDNGERRGGGPGHEPQSQRAWWGSYVLEEGRRGCWTVGPMRLWVEHAQREWRVAHEATDDQAGTAVSVEVPCADPVPGDIEVRRFSFRRTGPDLRIGLLPADRPVIARPETPLSIPPGQEVTIYVGSPLWFTLGVTGSKAPLVEMPVVRPSDTWFGPPTREGGLSYAARTLGRINLDDFPFSPLRAVTPVLIRNGAEQTLHVERLNLPAPFLSLYQAEDNTLWTEAIMLEHEEDDDGELALLHLDKGPPSEAGASVLLAGPRKRAERNLVVRAFSRLFSTEGG